MSTAGVNKVVIYQHDQRWFWRITDSDDADIATSNQAGYDSEQACLASLFTIFFGSYDESFLSVYSRWQANNAPEPFVRINRG